jgi:hypothetical protein
MDTNTLYGLVLIVAFLTTPVTVAIISIASVSKRRLDTAAISRKRLSHSETAAVEDAIVLTEELATQVGVILHILRRGPHAYPTDLPAGALWKAVAEVLERDGHVSHPESNGHCKPEGEPAKPAHQDRKYTI